MVFDIELSERICYHFDVAGRDIVGEVELLNKGGGRIEPLDDKHVLLFRFLWH